LPLRSQQLFEPRWGMFAHPRRRSYAWKVAMSSYPAGRAHAQREQSNEHSSERNDQNDIGERRRSPRKARRIDVARDSGAGVGGGGG
jgi:hypothetical protein